MHNLIPIVVVLVLVAIGAAVAVVVSSNSEKMQGSFDPKLQAKALAMNEPTPPSSKGMHHSLIKTTKLPASLYAGLNYGTPVLERLAITPAMLDVFNELDNLREAPVIGAEAVLYPRSEPTPLEMERFNSIALAAAKPIVRDQVVTVFEKDESRPQGKYAVYAFLDKGVAWGEDTVDYCTEGGKECIVSDVFCAKKLV